MLKPVEDNCNAGQLVHLSHLNWKGSGGLESHCEFEKSP